MPKEYSKEELWKLYESLPEELKEAVFSEEVADNIFNICVRNEVEDDRISEVARYAGRVLLGILPPEDFQEVLEKELNLEENVAKKIAREADRFIFRPVKPALEQLYQQEIAPAGETIKRPVTEEPARARPEIESTIPITKEKIEKEESARPTKRDTYREPIE